MRKGRGFLVKTGLLAIALVTALGSMGLVYSAWTDTEAINGTVITGVGDPVITLLARYPRQTQLATTWISDYMSGMELYIHVQNAQAGTSYRCDFELVNVGTLPETVRAVTIAGVPAGVGVYVAKVIGLSESPLEGTIIDPGARLLCRARVWLLTDVSPNPSLGTSFDLTVTITATLWNE